MLTRPLINHPILYMYKNSITKPIIVIIMYQNHVHSNRVNRVSSEKSSAHRSIAHLVCIFGQRQFIFGLRQMPKACATPGVRVCHNRFNHLLASEVTSIIYSCTSNQISVVIRYLHVTRNRRLTTSLLVCMFPCYFACIGGV